MRLTLAAAFAVAAVAFAVTAAAPWAGGCGSEARRRREETREKIAWANEQARLHEEAREAQEAQWAAERVRYALGRWEARRGERGEGFYAVMTLDLREDGTASATNTTADPATPGAEIRNAAVGTWEIENFDVVVRMEKFDDGRPVPEDKRELRLNLATNLGGPPEEHRLELLGEEMWAGGPRRVELTYRRRQEPGREQGDTQN